ncbi:MAG: hypothetical protein M1608_15265 [Candidatus Omnitrophica bacterium]|nr:hypothetical protein [Candidatus Omnitrophota bacterium]
MPAPRVTRDSPDALQVEMLLKPSSDYQIETSSDLVNWTLFTTVRSDDQGKVAFSASTEDNGPSRFYRAATP